MNPTNDNSKKKTQNKDEMSPPAVFNKNNKNIENYKDLKIWWKKLSKYKCIEKHGNLNIYWYPSCNFLI